MKSSLYVRRLTDEERPQLAAACRASDAFRVRRAQIVLASARGLSPKPSAQLVGCAVQTVRNVIHSLTTTGLACVAKHSTRPKRVAPTRDAATCERLQPSLPQSPRTDGKATGRWTLALVAPVCHEPGVTTRWMSAESIGRALTRLRTTGKRAKHWSTSPAPQDARNKSGAIA